MGFREEILGMLHTVSFTNLEYPICGNRSLLAANKIMNRLKITDLDSIYELAKVIEDNIVDKKISDKEFENIYKEVFRQYERNTTGI